MRTTHHEMTRTPHHELTRTAPRELVMVAERTARLRVTDGRISGSPDTPVDSLMELLNSGNASIRPLYGLSEDEMERRASDVAKNWVYRVAKERRLPSPLPPPPYFSLFYKISAPDAELDQLAKRLRQHPAVQTAYVKPGAELPLACNNASSSGGAGPARASASIRHLQVYLEPPEKGGINAVSAWEVPGGKGTGVNIIDIEGAWRFTHEDLENVGGLAGGVAIDDEDWRNHGTAVVGVLNGDHDNSGIDGICPDANVRAVSIRQSSSLPEESGIAAAIREAADLLDPGDLLIIEMQAPGPPDFQIRLDQVGYVPVEWWPDNLAAIQYAVGRGVIVVEAAANGQSNLDENIYDNNPPSPHGPFPQDWHNPLRRTGTDSGSILVGAGAPPLGFNNLEPERSRLDFSNFGSAVDAQGWGSSVATCGYGDLQRGPNEDLWYTKLFGGTSSATAMVAGALACVQGALQEAGRAPLDAFDARDLLRSTGLPQTDAPGRPATERIGNRPDIMEMINALSI